MSSEASSRTACRPNLHTLPAELVQQIFGYADRSKCDMKGNYCEDVDLYTFRLVCKDLYLKTLYLFVKRHREHFRKPSFEFSYHGLSLLLQLVSIPHVRDTFRRIELIQEREPEFCNNFGMEEWELWIEEQIQYILAISTTQDERGQFETSPEAYHMLKAIFVKLKDAKHLRGIRVTCGFEVALQSLEDSSFDRRLVELAVVHDHINYHLGKQSWTWIAEHASMLRSISLVAGYGLASNHFRYKPLASPGLNELLDATRTVDKVTIRSCQCDSRDWWPVCWGCQDLWKTNFYHSRYLSLKKLKLYGIFIDGGLFRNFLKENIETLSTLKLSKVKLTSSRWTKIFKTLQTAPLTYLRFGRLFQKPKEGRHILDCSPHTFHWTLEDIHVNVFGDNVQPFLDIMIHDPGYYLGGKYQEIQLRIIPGLSERV